MKNIRLLLIGFSILTQGCVSDMVVNERDIIRKYKTNDYSKISKRQTIYNNEIIMQRNATAFFREVVSGIGDVARETKDTIINIKRIKKEL